jgi:hypothetical protein
VRFFVVNESMVLRRNLIFQHHLPEKSFENVEIESVGSRLFDGPVQSFIHDESLNCPKQFNNSSSKVGNNYLAVLLTSITLHHCWKFHVKTQIN